jgi:multiple antibiotic resistance protein
MDLFAYSLKVFLALLVALTPFVGVSAFVAFSDGIVSKREKSRLVLKTSLAIAVMMLAFLFGGNYLFQLFGISLPAFQIAGGVVIFGNGLGMVRARAHEKYTAEEAEEGHAKEDFSVVPLATPILCGPATISAVVVYGTEAVGAPRLATPHMLALVAAIVAASLVTYVLLRLSTEVATFLGQTGMNVLTRIMGLLFASLGVEIIIKAAFALKIVT